MIVIRWVEKQLKLKMLKFLKLVNLTKAGIAFLNQVPISTAEKLQNDKSADIKFYISFKGKNPTIPEIFLNGCGGYSSFRPQGIYRNIVFFEFFGQSENGHTHPILRHGIGQVIARPVRGQVDRWGKVKDMWILSLFEERNGSYLNWRKMMKLLKV